MSAHLQIMCVHLQLVMAGIQLPTSNLLSSHLHAVVFCKIQPVVQVILFTSGNCLKPFAGQGSLSVDFSLTWTLPRPTLGRDSVQEQLSAFPCRELSQFLSWVVILSQRPHIESLVEELVIAAIYYSFEKTS